MKYSIGVDIGGTKIATAVLNEEKAILGRVQVPTNKTTPEMLFQQVVSCIEGSLKKTNLSLKDVCGIGVGVPGKVDCNKGIAIFQNNLPWKNYPLAEKLQSYFNLENVVIDNDVYMACFAEWVESNKKNRDTFVYLTISTGISCSIIHKEEFIRGSGFAGEIGFLPVKEKSPSNFQRLEEIASGPGIEKTALKYGVEDYKTVDIIEGYKQKETMPIKLINDVIIYYAKAIYSITCLVDPNRIVLGGGVINHNPYLLNEIKESLDRYLVKEQKDMLNRINISQFSNDAGLVGASLRVMKY